MKTRALPQGRRASARDSPSPWKDITLRLGTRRLHVQLNNEKGGTREGEAHGKEVQQSVLKWEHLKPGATRRVRRKLAPILGSLASASSGATGNLVWRPSRGGRSCKKKGPRHPFLFLIQHKIVSRVAVWQPFASPALSLPPLLPRKMLERYNSQRGISNN